MSRNSRIRVLLVEDEEPILDGLDALFSGQGFATRRAPDGAVALTPVVGDGFGGAVIEGRF